MTPSQLAERILDDCAYCDESGLLRRDCAAAERLIEAYGKGGPVETKEPRAETGPPEPPQSCNCDPLAQTGGGHAKTCPEWEPECTCYELTGGHMPGCYFNRERRW